MIVDANVLVSAVLGHSFSLVAVVQRRGHDLLVPSEQYREAELNGLRLAARKDLDGPRLVRLVLELVQPVEAAFYEHFEDVARLRLDKAVKAQRDWPLLALAMATGDAIWTNDKDLFGTGVATWSTVNIRFAQPITPSPEAE